MAKSIKPLLKRIFWSLSLLVLMVAGTGITLAYVYEAEVKQYVVSKINEHTQAKIKVETIELSFLRRFPMASLQFHNIEIKETLSVGNPGTLLKADNIFLKFSVFDLIQNKVVLKNVEIRGAQLNLVVFEDGSDNFRLFSNSSSDSSDFFIALDKVIFDNSTLHYTNYASKQVLDLQINKIVLSGEFSPNEFNINLNGSMSVQKYISESFTMITDKSVDLDVNLAIDPVSHKFNIRKGNIIYNQIPLSISGDIERLKEGVKLELELHSEFLSMVQLTKSVPLIYKQKFKDFELKGLMKIDGHINGYVVSRSMPFIGIKIKIKDCEIENKVLKTKWQHINLEAEYSNGKSHSLSTSSIQIHDFGFDMDFGSFDGKFQLNNFVNPEVQLQLNSKLELEELMKFTGKVFGISKIKGNADLNLKMTGTLKGFIGNQDIDFRGLDYQARLNLKGSSLMHKASDIYYENMVGSMRINSHSIVVEPTKVTINGKRHKIRAEIQNYRAWINKPSENKLIVRSFAEVSTISFSDIQQIIGSSESSDGIFPNDIDLKIQFKADSFLWENMNATNASGIFRMKNQVISFQDIRFNAFDGKINGNCSIEGSRAEQRPIIAKGELTNVDINRLFHDFNSFGQKIITDKNIKGKLTSDFVLNAKFDRDWKILSESIVLESNIRVTGGELNDIKELNALSNYTRIDDFSHIVFSELNNSIQISKRKLMIPDMTLKSNKLDLELSGTHDFDNIYDYHISVLMSDVLFNQAKQKSNNEFGEVQNDGYGRTKLFFHVYGQDDDIHVKYDRKGVAKKLKSDMKEEGESLKSVLNKEFGWFKNSQDSINSTDSLRKVNQLKKKEEQEKLNKQEEGQFIFEWDDEEDNEEFIDPPE